MAVERRIGAMQLEVEVKLFGRDDGGTAPRPTWMSCGLRMDEAQLPNTAHCTHIDALPDHGRQAFEHVNMLLRQRLQLVLHR
uniref:Uncharacterized protein n=1 Tax=Oryza rufipogon TaxID=4529 RepID=A0A0E0N1J7_ORYRU